MVSSVWISISPCLGAGRSLCTLFFFIVPGYSCWDTASTRTHARILGSSQSFRPKAEGTVAMYGLDPYSRAGCKNTRGEAAQSAPEENWPLVTQGEGSLARAKNAQGRSQRPSSACSSGCSIFNKSVNLMKDKDRPKNYSRLKETKETSQLTAMH